MAPFRSVLVTGGAGFVGANLALALKRRYEDVEVTALDNLKRRGSELNLPRLRQHGVRFLHGDIRNPEDLGLERIDLLLECSAEPSVMAAYQGGADYVVRTNLVGTVNCLELTRRTNAALVFLSTSRVYPVAALNEIGTTETETRFEIAPHQTLPGVLPAGISELFPMTGARSLYGATKLASELLIEEYSELFGLRYVINRCGVIAGPWQMGKVDQGVFALWIGKHYFGAPLTYLGWGGEGKQVRDLLHIDDLAELLERQLVHFDAVNRQTFNVGGGAASSLSLLETTRLCEEITGRTIDITSSPLTRPGDVRLYITDNARVAERTGWRPRRSPGDVLEDIYEWIRAHEHELQHVWN
jgi:CDP-paratose 2-epimerase